MSLLLTLAAGLFDLLMLTVVLDAVFGDGEPEAGKPVRPVPVVGRRRRNRI